MGRIAVGLFVFLFTMLSVSARPAVDTWKLIHTSGAVTVTNAVAAGDTLPPHTTITTGQDGRALLTRGGAAMLIGPGTTLRVDVGSRWVLEEGGRFQAERSDAVALPAQPKPRAPGFALQQPILAAVVKA
jgi:hypothetical protein